MIAAIVTLSLAAAPMESRLFIASGAKTKAEAEKQLKALKPTPELVLSAGFPKLVESKSIEGLNPGFFLVVFGACDDTSADQRSHNDGLAAVIQRATKGAYAKAAAKQAAACPLWLEELEKGKPVSTRAALIAKPDDVSLLVKAAGELHQAGVLTGAAMLLRRAIALGATGDAVELSRTVEFLLEDAPFRLPK